MKLFRRGIISTLIFFLTLLALDGLTQAAFETRGIGVRALGMGGAYVALVDDPSALYWNPAGLVGQEERIKLETSRTDLFGLGLFHDYFLIGIRRPVSAVGLMLERVNNDVEIAYREQKLQIGYAWKVANFQVGLAAKQLSVGIEEKNGKGWGIDAGILYRPAAERLAVGATFRDLGSKLTYNTNRSEEMPRELELGVTYFLPEDASFSVGFHAGEGRSFWRLGVEKQLMPALCFRLGYDGVGLGGGLSLRKNGFAVDYAFLPHSLGVGHHLAIGYSF